MAKNPKINPAAVQFSRANVLEGIQGIVTETFDRRTGVASVAPTASGQLRLDCAPVLEGDHINSLGVYCDTPAGVGVSLAKIGIWDDQGAFLGATGDFSGSLATQSWQGGAISQGTVIIPANGLVWMGILVVYATSAPSFRGASTPGNNWANLPTGRVMEWTFSGQSDITGNINFNNAGIGTQQYYIMAY